jgi:hypothetical protein
MASSEENAKRGEGEQGLCAPRLACSEGGMTMRDIGKKLISNLVAKFLVVCSASTLAEGCAVPRPFRADCVQIREPP